LGRRILFPILAGTLVLEIEIAVVLERSRRLLGNPWAQRAIIVAVIVWVFWNGIWAGVARSDHVQYLHHISQYNSLWDILSRSPSWNRTSAASVGDIILYRPVLYLLLGTLYYLFRYNFVAWQIASLCLHIVVVLGLYLLLIQGRLKQTLLPLTICLLFAMAFFASELVLWNHMVGYLLFCALDVYTVYFFLRFLQSDRTVFLIPCGALSLIGEFAYEAGALVNLLFAATLLARSFSAPVAGSSLTRSHRAADRWWALMFLVAALLLPIASLIDLRARGFALSPNIYGMEPGRMALLAGQAALLQIGFWLKAWLVPTAYHVMTLDRAIAEVSDFRLTYLRLLNLIGLSLLAVGGILALSRLRRSSVSWREPLLALTLSILFLLGYSIIIAIGRTIPRGLVLSVQGNTYYGYIANLTVCVGIAVAAVVGRSRVASMDARVDTEAPAPEASSGKSVRRSEPGRQLVPALTILALINAVGTHDLVRRYRYNYALPRQDVIDRMLAWHRVPGNRTQRYFEVGPSCRPGNVVLHWFDETRVRKDSGWRPPITLADALFPDRSAPLNAAKVYISQGSVDEIRCDGSSIGR
jgi:hypothetical protein